MNIDVWETRISYTNLLVNMMTDIGIKIFLNQKWFLPLNNSLTKVHSQPINLSLIKIQVQGNHSVNFLMFWISNKKLLFAG